MVEATVTMALSEYDELRIRLKEYEAERQKLYGQIHRVFGYDAARLQKEADAKEENARREMLARMADGRRF